MVRRSGEARVNTCLRASSVQGPWAHAGFQELCVHTLFKFVFHHIVMAAGNQPYWECLPHRNWQTPNSFFFLSSSPFSIQLFPFPLYCMLNILIPHSTSKHLSVGVRYKWKVSHLTSWARHSQDVCTQIIPCQITITLCVQLRWILM